MNGRAWIFGCSILLGATAAACGAEDDSVAESRSGGTSGSDDAGFGGTGATGATGGWSGSDGGTGGSAGDAGESGSGGTAAVGGTGGAGGTGGTSGAGADGGTGAGGGASGAGGTSGWGGTGGSSGCATVTSQTPSFAAGWGDYGGDFGPTRYYKDATGEVHVEGLVSKLGGDPVQSDVIATLPEGFRPGERLVFASHSGVHGRIDINVNGTILWIKGHAWPVGSKDYTGLTSVRFRPGPTSTDVWITPKMASGWLNYGGGFAPAAYRKDANNMVHLHGLIKKSGAVAAETIFTLPLDYRPPARLIFLVESTGIAGRIDILPDGVVRWYPGNAGHVSLNGISFHATADAWPAPVLAGTWANFGSGFAPVGYHADCSTGMVHLRGLVTQSGGTPAKGLVFTLPEGHRPKQRLLFAAATGEHVSAPGSATAGRVDVYPNGEVHWIGGATKEKDYTSFSGISFAR